MYLLLRARAHKMCEIIFGALHVEVGGAAAVNVAVLRNAEAVEVEVPADLARAARGGVARGADGVGVALAWPGDVFFVVAAAAGMASKIRVIDIEASITFIALNIVNRPTISGFTIRRRRTSAAIIHGAISAKIKEPAAITFDALECWTFRSFGTNGI
jgi:hypothetical protein